MNRPPPSSSPAVVDEVIQTAWSYMAVGTDKGRELAEAMQQDPAVREWFEGGVVWGMAATYDVLDSYGLIKHPRGEPRQ